MRLSKKITHNFDSVFYDDYIKNLSSSEEYKLVKHKNDRENEERFYHKSGQFYIKLRKFYNDFRYMEMGIWYEPMTRTPDFIAHCRNEFVGGLTNVPRRGFTPLELNQKSQAEQERIKNLMARHEAARESQEIDAAKSEDILKMASRSAGLLNHQNVFYQPGSGYSIEGLVDYMNLVGKSKK